MASTANFYAFLAGMPRRKIGLFLRAKLFQIAIYYGLRIHDFPFVAIGNRNTAQGVTWAREVY